MFGRIRSRSGKYQPVTNVRSEETAPPESTRGEEERRVEKRREEKGPNILDSSEPAAGNHSEREGET